MTATLASVKELIRSAIPGVRFTSGERSQAEQDRLVAAGKTRAKNSQHVSKTGLDLVLPKGFDSTDVDGILSKAGISLSESINETGKGRNQGTGPHLHIGWGDKSKGGDPKRGGGSTFDRVTAARQPSEPSLANVFEAYRSGNMEPKDAAALEDGVRTGAIVPPRGFKMAKEAPAFALPKEVIAAYNSRAMEPDERAAIDQALANGEVSLPRGVKLQAPAPRTALENLGMGARNVATGLGSTLDIVAGPVNALVNALPGEQGLSTTPGRDAANYVADAAGLATPESSSENLIRGITEGATSGLVTAGAGIPLSTVKGVTGMAGKALAASPVADIVSGATSGAAQEGARQSGAGPVGQLAAGLAGGGAGLGSVMAMERGAARLSRSGPRSAPEIVAETPREVVIDRKGNLTEEGQELALRHDIAPEDLKQAYDAPPNVRPANDGTTPEAQARAVNDELPIERVQEAPPVRATVVEEAPPPAPRVEPEPIPTQAYVDGTVPTTAPERVAQAASEQVPLSRGQATQDFATQDAEQTLRAQASGEGEQARVFTQQQAEAVKDATTRFRATFDDPETSPAVRGQAVKDALRELRDLGKQGISALYKEGRELGSDAVKLETGDISNAAKRALVEADIPDSVKGVIRQEMARYGLIGKEAVTAEDGLTTVKLDDGRKIQFYGPVEQLGLDNAENFRQAISAQYMTDGPRKLSQPLKRAIDDAVEAAVERAATTEKGDVGAKMKEARAAVVAQEKTFSAKDVVQKLIDWKKGTQTDLVLPENAIKEIFAGDTTNLSKVKALLLSKPTTASKAAWRAIQAQGVAQIFEKAVQRNANLGGGAIEAISGAKLRTAIEQFGGSRKLRVLLDEPDFNRLMKLQRIIGDVTIPISGTTNPSGSAFKLMRFLGPVAAKIVPFGGQVAETVAGLVKQGREIAASKETLKGVTEYSASEAAKETAKQMPGPSAAKADAAAREFLAKFIDIASSERLIAPIIAAGNNGGDDQ